MKSHVSSKKEKRKEKKETLICCSRFLISCKRFFLKDPLLLLWSLLWSLGIELLPGFA
jgi:hypothetical protein